MSRARLRIAAMAMGALLPAGLGGCADGGARSFDYAELASDARTACAVLSAQADTLVAAGRLDPTRTKLLESEAQLAVAALAAPLAAQAAHAGAVGALDLARLQTLARDVRTALAALAAIIPPGTLPPPVSAALAIADALLDAFIGVGPMQMRVTLAGSP
ncbi:hypothetical protein FHR90_002714 [Endobacter medicaginis]|jgi:hypothetical protein|uniref:Lipoprotein n=1 Tax=Endobacter medicaginis TaxID=1181271 RepID=A0A839UYD7_9PROT|nr:hypothetical protein [Endobacter medicaginis]MBB3174867.1 hypothetical protein [Endobacter medicaginis]MCX5475601.1 hypothetical protein [Endobacter medicaginis]